MANAASVNFQKVQSALHSVGHASRTQPPEYLLPEDHRLGNVLVKDDRGLVAKRLEQKMLLASGVAKASKNYSPLHEGVVNLPDIKQGQKTEDYRAECGRIVRQWCKEYERLSGHEVLRADVHLDEGHINEEGTVKYNAHAHVIADRTNETGRVQKLDRAKLREIQTMTAEVTGLNRGVSASVTKLKHINSNVYRVLAKDNDLKHQKELVLAKEQGHKEGFAEGQKLAKDELDEMALAHELLKLRYNRAREELKASGTAKQADYQRLKAENDALKADLAKLKEEASKPRPGRDEKHQVEPLTPDELHATRKLRSAAIGLLSTYREMEAHDPSKGFPPYILAAVDRSSQLWDSIGEEATNLVESGHKVAAGKAGIGGLIQVVQDMREAPQVKAVLKAHEQALEELQPPRAPGKDSDGLDLT
jgi:hypothetical protein